MSMLDPNDPAKSAAFETYGFRWVQLDTSPEPIPIDIPMTRHEIQELLVRATVAESLDFPPRSE